MTYKDAAQMALDIQDASNLSGLVYAIKPVMDAVCERSHEVNTGTEWLNRHPIITMFLLKLSELNGCGSTLHESYNRAEELCKKLAAGERVEGF